MHSTEQLEVRRFGPDDLRLARTTFGLMAEVFGENRGSLSDTYIHMLLARTDFWVLGAMTAGTVVGGLTAHTLMMTSFEGAEVFVYDIAVSADHRRRGVGRQLVDHLRREASSAGIGTTFVLADDEDAEALDFYTALGGKPSKVTLFEFTGRTDAEL